MTTDSELFRPVFLRTGQDEGTQISSFQNATFQRAGENLALSIATTIQVPDEVVAQGEAAVATWVEDALWQAASAVKGKALTFEVHVGPSDEASNLD